MVDSYRVVRPIGHGGMGEVWLARDTTLGRRVALKVVKPSRLSAAGAEAQFLEEARMTARFAHPNIVTVYGVGRTHDTIWVALEFLEGSTLRQRLASGSPGYQSVLRTGLAIADALIEAHGAGVLHRDLKPENIMLPPDGRLRVLDFGLATARGSDDRRILGTPHYMAPERWEPGEPAEAADIWSLGLILYELCSGQHPYPQAVTPAIALAVCDPAPVPPLPNAAELPADLVAVIADCLEKTPEKRPSALIVATRLRAALELGRARRSHDECPFPGLMAFGEHQADVFFGRDDEVSALVEQLRVRPVLPVVGPSGAGKSSLVLAGLLPRLKEADRWTVLTVRPGLRPFKTLAGQLLARHGSVGELLFPTMDEDDSPGGAHPTPAEPDEDYVSRSLAEQPQMLSVMLHSIADAHACRVLLFVDQLEELYTHATDPDERRRFMAALLRAADDPSDPVRVVFTLRDDFLGRVAEGVEAARILSQIAVVRSPGPEALRQTLTGPLDTMGWRFEDPELPDRMVAEVAGEPSALPLLQFAARRLWEHRDAAHRTLTVAAYEAIGGVSGALAEHADGVLETLPPVQVRVAQAILLRLVHADGTRRVVSRGEVLAGLADGANAVLDRLISARLLATRRADANAASNESELEIVHESLTTHWATLARWIDEGREELAFLGEVRQAADFWQRRGRSDDAVWTAEALTDAQRMAGKLATVPVIVTDFLSAGQKHADRASRRRRTLLTLSVAVLLALAIAGFVVALAFEAERGQAVAARDQAQSQRVEAETQREAADEQRAAVQRQAAVSAWKRGDFVAARALVRSALETEDHVQLRALWRQMRASRWRWRSQPSRGIRRLAASPDGQLLATVSLEGGLRVLDIETQRALPIRHGSGKVSEIQFSDDGLKLVGIDRSGSWWRRRISDGELVGEVQLPAGATRFALAPGGTHVVWADATHVGLTDASNRVTARCRRSTMAIQSVNVSHDLKTALVGLHGQHIVGLDLASCARRFELDGAITEVLKGGMLISRAQNTRLVDVHSGEVIKAFDGGARAAAEAPDGVNISILRDSLETWELKTGHLVSRVPMEGPGSATATYTPSGLLATGGYMPLLYLLDPTRPNPQPESGHTDVIWRVALDAQGTTLASASHDGTVRVWDVDSATERIVIQGSGEPFGAVAFSPVAPMLATGDFAGEVELWSSHSGSRIGRLRGHKGGVISAVFSDDGVLLATGSQTPRIWRIEDRAPQSTGPDLKVAVTGLAFSHDSEELVWAAQDGRLGVFATLDGKPRLDMRGHTREVRGLAFTADDTRIVSGSVDTTIREWDAQTGAELKKLAQPWPVFDLALIPGARAVVTATADGSVWEVDLDSGARSELSRHGGEVNGVAVSGDGRLVASSSDDRTVRVWSRPSAAPHWHTRFLHPDSSAILARDGWKHRGAPGTSPTGQWVDALLQRGARARAAGQRLCLITRDGGLEVWDTAADRLLSQIPASELGTTRRRRAVHATRTACFVATEDGLAWYEGTGSKPAGTASGAVGLWPAGDSVLTSRDGLLLELSSGGKQDRVKVADVSVATKVASGLLLGHNDGRLTLQRPNGAKVSMDVSTAPASPITALTAAPRHTVLAGFADGFFGLWSLETGALLESGRLHGPVTQLEMDGDLAHIVSELGQYEVRDYSTLTADWCALLREVWDETPVVLVDGTPTRRAVPTGHPCRR